MKRSTKTKKDLFLKEVIRMQCQPPLASEEYYLITLLGNEDGTVSQFVDTYWVGFTDTKPRREIRKASTVEPISCSTMLNHIKEPCVIVNDRKDLSIFLLIGGHGIIIKSIAESFFSDSVNPHPVVKSFSKGFMSVSSLPENVINYAPSKKLRMSILKRDNFRCLICGRSPKNNVDLELNVHHILPWGLGGTTEEDNLITICTTCHGGLEPHYEPQLFEILGISREPPHIFGGQKLYAKRLLIYMNYIKEKYYSRDPVI